jgi:predicted Rossmann fold flavoprotein
MEYDVIVIGAGASGLIAAIQAAKNNQRTLLLEKLSQIGTKLKSTGGGRCNLSNTLDNVDFMQSFGKNGRFITTALNQFDYKKLMNFFKELGVDTHIPDGFRIFPITHNSTTIINALEKELQRLNVTIICDSKVKNILTKEDKIIGLKTNNKTFYTKNIILATGGLGYPSLGSTGDGHKIATNIGHNITALHPAMMPLKTKETWQSNCTANTIAKSIIKVNIPNNKKLNKLKATGDLIFTKNGIRGPVVLDFAREITPYLDKYKEVPILINMVKGMNESDIVNHIKKISLNNNRTIIAHLSTILPKNVSIEFCKLNNVDINSTFKSIKGENKNKLIKMIASTPLTIIGHDGFKKAMITRGGINLKEIDPNTMQSKFISGLYFCGEILDLDGPCGGYNLQFAFSSGYLAGKQQLEL